MVYLGLPDGKNVDTQQWIVTLRQVFQNGSLGKWEMLDSFEKRINTNEGYTLVTEDYEDGLYHLEVKDEWGDYTVTYNITVGKAKLNCKAG